MDAPHYSEKHPGMMRTLPVGIDVKLPGGLHCSIRHNFGPKTRNPLRLATEFATLHGDTNDTNVNTANESTASV